MILPQLSLAGMTTAPAGGADSSPLASQRFGGGELMFAPLKINPFLGAEEPPQRDVFSISGQPELCFVQGRGREPLS